MKFGKTLLNQQIPEYTAKYGPLSAVSAPHEKQVRLTHAASYINYKALKKVSIWRGVLSNRATAYQNA
jgi:hypothetical protein